MQPIPEFRASDFTRHRSDLFDAADSVAGRCHQASRAEVRLDEHGSASDLARGGTRQVHMLEEMADD